MKVTEMVAAMVEVTESASEGVKKNIEHLVIDGKWKRRKIEVIGDWVLICLGEMEIWDNADLALLREAFFQLENNKVRYICVDLRYVKYIPSGFFGMLADWQEKTKLRFSLTTPQPNVQQMVWFRTFFKLFEEIFLESGESTDIFEMLDKGLSITEEISVFDPGQSHQSLPATPEKEEVCAHSDDAPEYVCPT